MSNEDESLPNIDLNSDALIPVTRVLPGDLLNLKGSHVLTRCPCDACDIAKELAEEGHMFKVEFAGPGELLRDLGINYSPGTWVVVTDEYTFTLWPTQYVPVREFHEGR